MLIPKNPDKDNTVLANEIRRLEWSNLDVNGQARTFDLSVQYANITDFRFINNNACHRDTSWKTIKSVRKFKGK